jgi:hypothetical protein
MDPETEVLRYGVAIAHPSRNEIRFLVAHAGGAIKFTYWFAEASTWPLQEKAHKVARKMVLLPGEFVAVVHVVERKYND